MVRLCVLLIGRTMALWSLVRPVPPALQAKVQDHTAWNEYGGGADSSKFTRLSQITKANVNQLSTATN